MKVVKKILRRVLEKLLESGKELKVGIELVQYHPLRLLESGKELKEEENVCVPGLLYLRLESGKELKVEIAHKYVADFFLGWNPERN